MRSFTVIFALFLVRLLCSWLQRFLGDYVSLESLVDSCWMCGKVAIQDHSNLDYVTIVFRLILLISIIAIYELVFIVPWAKVIFDMDFFGRRPPTWTLEHPISMWCLSPGYVTIDLFLDYSYFGVCILFSIVGLLIIGFG